MEQRWSLSCPALMFPNHLTMVCKAVVTSSQLTDLLMVYHKKLWKVNVAQQSKKSKNQDSHQHILCLRPRKHHFLSYPLRLVSRSHIYISLPSLSFHILRIMKFKIIQTYKFCWISSEACRCVNTGAMSLAFQISQSKPRQSPP